MSINHPAPHAARRHGAFATARPAHVARAPKSRDAGATDTSYDDSEGYERSGDSKADTTYDDSDGNGERNNDPDLANDDDNNDYGLSTSAYPTRASKSRASAARTASATSYNYNENSEDDDDDDSDSYRSSSVQRSGHSSAAKPTSTSLGSGSGSGSDDDDDSGSFWGTSSSTSYGTSPYGLSATSSGTSSTGSASGYSNLSLSGSMTSASDWSSASSAAATPSSSYDASSLSSPLSSSFPTSSLISSSHSSLSNSYYSSSSWEPSSSYSSYSSHHKHSSTLSSTQPTSSSSSSSVAPVPTTSASSSTPQESHSSIDTHISTGSLASFSAPHMSQQTVTDSARASGGVNQHASDPHSGSSSGMGTGGIVGAAVGAACGALLLLVVSCLLWRKCRSKPKAQPLFDDHNDRVQLPPIGFDENDLLGPTQAPPVQDDAFAHEYAAAPVAGVGAEGYGMPTALSDAYMGMAEPADPYAHLDRGRVPYDEEPREMAQMYPAVGGPATEQYLHPNNGSQPLSRNSSTRSASDDYGTTYPYNAYPYQFAPGQYVNNHPAQDHNGMAPEERQSYQSNDHCSVGSVGKAFESPSVSPQHSPRMTQVQGQEYSHDANWGRNVSVRSAHHPVGESVAEPGYWNGTQDHHGYAQAQAPYDHDQIQYNGVFDPYAR